MAIKRGRDCETTDSDCESTAADTRLELYLSHYQRPRPIKMALKAFHTALRPFSLMSSTAIIYRSRYRLQKLSVRSESSTRSNRLQTDTNCTKNRKLQ